jgi:hypothetical protein
MLPPAVLDQLEGQLAPHWIETAAELLQNGEPNEAPIQIVWGIPLTAYRCLATRCSG